MQREAVVQGDLAGKLVATFGEPGQKAKLWRHGRKAVGLAFVHRGCGRYDDIEQMRENRLGPREIGSGKSVQAMAGDAYVKATARPRRRHPLSGRHERRC